jgi:hypothetical protein
VPGPAQFPMRLDNAYKVALSVTSPFGPRGAGELTENPIYGHSRQMSEFLCPVAAMRLSIRLRFPTIHQNLIHH